MKYLVVYSSQTGNTKKLAQAVYDALPGEEKRICAVEEAPDPSGFDWIAVGFWLMAGKPDPKAQEYLKRIDGQRVFLFATHGAHPASEHARKAMETAKALLQGGEVVGTFSCQGEVDPKVLEKAKAKDPQPVWLKDAPDAQGHPDAEDLAEIAAQVKTLAQVSS